MTSGCRTPNTPTTRPPAASPASRITSRTTGPRSREIFRQVGDELVLDEAGIARRGMIIRHLVLPGGLADTPGVMRWIATELSPHVHISVMDQYFPAYKALDDPLMGRKITPEEYEAALDAFDAAGLENGWLQEHEECGE